MCQDSADPDDPENGGQGVPSICVDEHGLEVTGSQFTRCCERVSEGACKAINVFGKCGSFHKHASIVDQILIVGCVKLAPWPTSHFVLGTVCRRWVERSESKAGRSLCLFCNSISQSIDLIEQSPAW